MHDNGKNQSSVCQLKMFSGTLKYNDDLIIFVYQNKTSVKSIKRQSSCFSLKQNITNFLVLDINNKRGHVLGMTYSKAELGCLLFMHNHLKHT